MALVFLDVSPLPPILYCQSSYLYYSNVPIGGTTFILILAFLHLKQTEEQRQYRSMGKHEALKHMVCILESVVLKVF